MAAQVHQCRSSKQRAGRRARLRSDQPLVSRLIGLETEYATIAADGGPLSAAQLPASAVVYRQVCQAVQNTQPTASGVYDSEQLFLANGAAMTFESHPSLHHLPGGLIEVATPEVRSPADLLQCQRAIDQMIAEAASVASVGVDLRILKNSSDALGHVYGCQENYEAVVARGVWLAVYRGLMLLLWTVHAFSFAVALPFIAVLIGMALVQAAFQRGWRGIRADAATHFDSLPRWISAALIGLLRWMHTPAVWMLRFIGRHVAFRSQRRYLTSLLVSRVALCGAGELAHDGRYRISAKAMAIDCVADMGGFSGERPIFLYGHWLGSLGAKSFTSYAATRQMFRRHQRLQIGLSDSNLADLAEYVKVGSASLVLDMIEAGATKGLPVLRQTTRSLHRIARDWNLVTRVPTSRGEMSALEIQRVYLRAAEKFVAGTPANRRGEADLVVQRWRELFDAVSEYRRSAEAMENSLVRVDWLSKRWMIDQVPAGQWPERKKIDLRYHELSRSGYFHQLSELRPDRMLVSPSQVQRRRRSPPANTPASRRGWFIREFADSVDRLESEWSYGLIGRGRQRKRVDFDRGESRVQG